jgi:tRNA A58 N-methylase Trm61
LKWHGFHFELGIDDGGGTLAMTAALAWLLVQLLFAGPVYAESRCSECFKAADEEFRACIENAISVEDKNSCDNKQEEQAKRCENSECKVERENREASGEAPSQGR